MTKTNILIRWAVPLGLTLLALGLRLYGLVTFKGGVDHTYPIAQVITALQTGVWPVLGQYTSVLLDNPPGMPYLLLGPWWLLRNLWALHVFVVLVNTLAVPLLYSGVRRLTRREAQAQLAAFLLAINPWVIYHSQGTWVQGFSVVGTTAIYVCLLMALFGARGAQRGHWLVAAFGALALFTQTYLLAFLCAVQMAVVLALSMGRWTWRALAVGGLIFALPTAFYLAQIAAHWPTQAAKLTSFFSPPAEAAPALTLNPAALDHALRFVTGRDYEVVYGNDGSPLWAMRHSLATGLSTLLALAVTAGVGWVLWLGLRQARLRHAHWAVRAQPVVPSAFWGLTLLWWALPIGLMSVGERPIHVHYLLMSLPAGFVLIAPALAWVTRWRPLRIGLLLCLLLSSWLALEANMRYAAAHPVEGNWDNLTLAAKLTFQHTAAPLIDEYGLTELYVGRDAASMTTNTGRAVQTVNWYSLPDLLIAPVDRPALYLQLSTDQPAPLPPLATRTAQLVYPNANFITFDLVPAYDRTQWAERPQHPVAWPSAQGLTLLGYDLNPAELVLYYVVDELATGRAEWLFAPYAHVLNAQGELVANVGTPGLPGYLYRLGDVYRYRLTLPPLSAGAYQLELGLFDGVHGGVGGTFLPPGGLPQPFYGAAVEVK